MTIASYVMTPRRGAAVRLLRRIVLGGRELRKSRGAGDICIGRKLRYRRVAAASRANTG
jgi:hypothetical protein